MWGPNAHSVGRVKEYRSLCANEDGTFEAVVVSLTPRNNGVDIGVTLKKPYNGQFTDEESMRFGNAHGLTARVMADALDRLEQSPKLSYIVDSELSSDTLLFGHIMRTGEKEIEFNQRSSQSTSDNEDALMNEIAAHLGKEFSLSVGTAAKWPPSNVTLNGPSAKALDLGYLEHAGRTEQPVTRGLPSIRK